LAASISKPHSDADGLGAFVPGPRIKLAPTATGALNGRTFAVKDLIDVAGARTGAGNPDWLWDQGPASTSAPVVRDLLAAGATLVGKTITDELAFSLEGANAYYGTPVNPSCPDRIPGGSSSGSAVAVAGGLVDFAIGTDTGGSVRVPASFVGVLGFRPTHGAISLAGVVPFAPSYDTVGWFAGDAATLAAVGEALLPIGSPPPIRRFRLVRDAFSLADADVSALLLRQCEALGIDDDLTLFDSEESEWLECYRVLQGAEIWQQLGAWIRSAKPRFGEAIAPRFADAASIASSEIERYRPMRAAMAKRVRAALGDGTALVIPTAPCVALPKDADGAEISEFYRRALALTSLAGHSGVPQVSVPAGRVNGCPLGLSMLATPGHDRALLQAAVRWTERLSESELP
jgi:amidase